MRRLASSLAVFLVVACTREEDVRGPESPFDAGVAAPLISSTPHGPGSAPDASTTPFASVAPTADDASSPPAPGTASQPPPPASINGKPPADATSSDVEQAIRDAECAPKLLAKSGALRTFGAACGERAYEVAWAGKGAALTDAQREASTRGAASFDEGGVLLAVKPLRGTDLSRARALVRALRGDPDATVEGELRISVSSSGGSSPTAQRVLANMNTGFRRCYVAALQAAGAPVGSFRIDLVLSSTGAVTSSTARDVPVELAGSELVSCKEARGAKGVFEPPESIPSTLRLHVKLSKKTVRH